MHDERTTVGMRRWTVSLEYQRCTAIRLSISDSNMVTLQAHPIFTEEMSQAFDPH